MHPQVVAPVAHALVPHRRVVVRAARRAGVRRAAPARFRPALTARRRSVAGAALRASSRVVVALRSVAAVAGIDVVVAPFGFFVGLLHPLRKRVQRDRIADVLVDRAAPDGGVCFGAAVGFFCFVV